MRLETRLNRLEKKKGIDGVLMAFIGVPNGTSDVFDEAHKFWDKEKTKFPHSDVSYAVPWPPYPGSETKFLGLGTQDDFYFGLCGGVRDLEKCRFIFLDEVADLIKNHWKEVKMVMNTHIKNRDELMVSEEALEIMLCMTSALSNFNFRVAP